MTQAELRQAKANLHYDIVNNILSYGGTWQEDVCNRIGIIGITKKLFRNLQKTIDKLIKVCYNKNVNKRYTKTKRKEVLKNGKSRNLILYL